MQNFHILLTSFMMFNILIQNNLASDTLLWSNLSLCSEIQLKLLILSEEKSHDDRYWSLNFFQNLGNHVPKNMHADLQLFIGITHSVYTTIKLIRKLVRVTSVCKRRWFTSRCHNISFWKLITTLLFRNMQQWSNI